MPVAGDREVVIKVAAAGIARADTLQRQGKYPPPQGASDIPGLDVAGTIHSVGNGITEFAMGDAVCAILAGASRKQQRCRKICLPFTTTLSRARN